MILPHDRSHTLGCVTASVPRACQTCCSCRDEGAWSAAPMRCCRARADDAGCDKRKIPMSSAKNARHIVRFYVGTAILPYWFRATTALARCSSAQPINLQMAAPIGIAVVRLEGTQLGSGTLVASDGQPLKYTCSTRCGQLWFQFQLVALQRNCNQCSELLRLCCSL